MANRASLTYAICDFFFFTAQVVPGLLVLLIIYFGCDRVLVLITWFTVVTLITASYAGAMANIVDIAPNFAGTRLLRLFTRGKPCSFFPHFNAVIYHKMKQLSS